VIKTPLDRPHARPPAEGGTQTAPGLRRDLLPLGDSPPTHVDLPPGNGRGISYLQGRPHDRIADIRRSSRIGHQPQLSGPERRRHSPVLSQRLIGSSRSSPTCSLAEPALKYLASARPARELRSTR